MATSLAGQVRASSERVTFSENYAEGVLYANLCVSWTRSQRIRIAAETPFEIALLDAVQVPPYQRIAPQAQHLWQPGLSCSCIAKHLGVTDKTVAKAISWQNRMR